MYDHRLNVYGVTLREPVITTKQSTQHDSLFSYLCHKQQHRNKLFTKET